MQTNLTERLNYRTDIKRYKIVKGKKKWE
jgi:hypothetical protein